MSGRYLKPALLRTLLTVGAVIGIAQSAQTSFGPGMGGLGMGRHHQFMGHLVKELELTEAQQTQIKSICKQEKEAIEPLMLQLATNRKQMLELTASGNFPEAKVRELANQNAPIIAQLMVEKEKLMSQVYNQVPMPEQRTKADAMRARHEERLDHALQHLTEIAPVQE